MAASTQQKLDYLLKKIGYTASKTGLAEDSSLSGTKKAPFAESIPSPLVTANSSIWTDSDSIPGTPPGSDSSYVKVYLASASGHRMTVDSTVSGSRAFIAYSTYNNTSTAILGDWIDTQFGDSYIIKVYKGDPNSGGTLLSAAGSGSNDTWFFDYASGVLNFNGTVVPSGVTDTNIYLVGYRYIGAKGTAVAGINTEGTSTFENITVDGNAGIGSLNVTGVSTFAGHVGLTTSLNVTGIATFNDNMWLGTTGYDQIHVGGRFASHLLTYGSGDIYDLGSSTEGWKNLYLTGNAGIGSLNVTGVSTFVGAIDANGDLDVDGHTELDNVNVAGVSTFNSTTNLDGTVSSNNSAITVSGSKTLQINNDAQRLRLKGTGTLGAVESIALQLNTNAEGGSTQHALVANENSSVKIYHSGNEKLRTTGVGVTIFGNTETQTLNVTGVSTFTGAIDANGNLDVDGYTELDQVNVSAASTFGGLVDIDAGAQANTLKVEDLTDNRIVIAGTGGELEDTTKLTFDGSTLAIVGDATFSGNVTIGGTLTKEDVTNIDSVGLITAQSGIRVVGGGVSVASGVATFSDSAYFPDNSKIKFGDATTADLEIYHSGTNSYIKEAGTGSLIIQAANFVVEDLSGNDYLYAVDGGTTALLFDGSKKFETTSTGSIVTGVLTATSFSGTLLTAAQANITSVGTLTSLDVSGNITGAGDLTLTDTTADSAAGPELKLFRNSASPADADYIGQIKFAGESDTGVERNYAKITGKIGDASNGTEDGILEFAHIKAGSQTITGRWNSTTLQLLNGTNLTVAGEVDVLGGVLKLGEADTASGHINAYENMTFNIDTDNDDTNRTFKFQYDGESGSGNTILELKELNKVAIFSGNVGIGTDAPTDPATSANTSVTSVGILTAYKLYGDGTLLTGIVTATGISTTGTSTFENIVVDGNAGIGSLNVTGVSTFTGASTFDGYVYFHGDVVRLGNSSSDTITGSGRFQRDVTPSSSWDYNLGQADRQWQTLFSKQLKISGISTLGITSTTWLETEQLNVTGVSTFAGITSVTSTHSALYVPQLSSSGVVTATAYYGDGSNLTNVSAAATDAWIADSQENLVAGNGAGAARDGTNTCYNVLTGYEAGKALKYGVDNVYLGCQVGLAATGGDQNVFIGAKVACTGVVTGDSNVAIGHRTGANLTSGSHHILIGRNAGLGVTANSDNIALGYNALYGTGEVSGGKNVAIGRRAARCLTTANGTVAIGWCPAHNLTTGSGNVILGMCVARCITEGPYNVIIGSSAGIGVTDAGCNVYIGHNSGSQNGYNSGVSNIAIGQAALNRSTGDYNIALGKSAGKCTTTDGGVFIGCYAGRCNTSAQNSIVIGRDAASLSDITGNANIILGTDAAQNITSGAHNVFMGHQVGCDQTITGSDNIMLGCRAGACLSSGAQNLFIGSGAASQDVVTGSYNVAFGYQSGCALTSGATHILIGKYAGKGLGGSQDNIFMGKYSGCATSGGSYNVAIGANTMIGSGNKTGNTSLGRFAGCAITAAQYNTFLGYGAGHHTTTGCYNIAIGCAVCLSANSASNELAIGCGTKRWICGDSNFNVGIGTNPADAVGSATTSKLSVGIVSAYQLYGDGSNLSNVGAAATNAWIQDSQGNLFAGTAAGAARDADTCFNIGIGQSAGKALNEGDSNIFLGCFAAPAVTSGSGNLAIGEKAGELWETASQSIAIGYRAGSETATNSNNNIFLGTCAGRYSRGHNNVYIGRCANAAGTNYGSSSVIIGAWAGSCNGSGENTYVGGGAGYYSKGQFNTLLGYYAGGRACGSYCSTWVGAYSGCGTGTEANYTGDCNVGMGNRAGRGMTSGHSVVMIGNEAGCKNSSGSQNVYLGQRAAYHGETGSCNVAIGNSVFLPITNGDSQLVIGVGSSLGWINGNANMNVGIGTTNPDIAVGVGNTAKLSVGIVSAYQLYGDGSNLTNVSAGGTNTWEPDSEGNLVAGTGAGAARDGDTYCNVIIGKDAGSTLNSGDYNVFLGFNAGKASTSNSGSVHIGQSAGQCMCGFSRNIFIGENAGSKLCRGSANIAIGADALCGGCSSGEELDYTIAIGCQAAKNLCEGADNVFIGKYVGLGITYSVNNVMIGQCAGAGAGTSPGTSNIFIGPSAGCDITTGGNNLYMGSFAGANIESGSFNVGMGRGAGQAQTTGSSNVFLGRYSGNTVNTGNTNIAIGCYAGCASFDVGGTEQVAIGFGARNHLSGKCLAFNSWETTIAGVATVYSATGIVSATKFCGDGSALTGTGGETLISGITVQEESSTVGTAGSITTLDFQGATVTASASGSNKAIITVTAGAGSTDGWISDSQENLFAGTSAGASRDADTCFNIGIGYSAGNALNAGDDSIFLGRCAGKSATSGNKNIAFGCNTIGCCAVTGSANIALGTQSGSRITSGSKNVFIGDNTAAGAVITGGYNVAFGAGAARCLTSGQWNFIGGYNAGRCITEGGYNILLGVCAGANATLAGDHNIALGNCAGYKLTSGACNVLLGKHAGYELVDGTFNTLIGHESGQAITSGNNNVAIGKWAAYYVTTAINNTYVGGSAGVCRQTGNNNVAIGLNAFTGSSTAADNTGGGNTVVGADAGCGVTSGSTNVLVGCNAGKSVSSGSDSILIGCAAGDAVTTGNRYIAIGKAALSAEDTAGEGAIAIGCGALLQQNATTGNNTAVGYQAGCNLVDATENVFLGFYAGRGVTGSNNVALGPKTLLSSTSGTGNVAVGQDAMRQNTGNYNVVMGATAMWSAGDGTDNVIIGQGAGYAVTDGDKNTFLGRGTGNTVTTGCCNVLIGYDVDAVAASDKTFKIGIAANSWITGDSSFNTTVNDISASNFNSTSDIRLKTNIQPIGDPIGKVKQIEGVSFNWKKDNKPALGVIADQVEKILPELVHGDDPKTVNYNGLIGLLIETVKEQQNQIDELNDRISKLE